MCTLPRTASVVIPSYNYGRFVGAAIESALHQSEPPLDVIVVDDGSVDDSRRVIERYGGRVTALFKENGGHASSINAGCRLARGDVVFLLDSDDVLEPTAVETVLRSWRPDTVLLHSRLAMMDRDGQSVEGRVPAPWVRLAEGDLRERLVRTGGFATTVTSGLVLRRDALMRVLPIPEDVFRQGADGYLVRALAFEGRVQALDLPLSRYRRHGQNDSELGGSPEAIADALRRRLALARNELGAVRQIARAHGYAIDERVGEDDPEYLYIRLASLALEPGRHPFPSDVPLRLLGRLLLALPSTQPLWSRVVLGSMASGVSFLPRRLAARLLAWRHTPATRPRWLSQFAAWGRRSLAR